jgi:Kef-type K+ transport system membrane component KefB
MGVLEYIRSHALALPPLAKFALSMVIIFGIPPLSRRVRLPTVVGLLLIGVVVGPHVLDVFGEQRPIAEFFADLGRLLAMFVTGLGIDLAHLRQAKRRSILFGLSTSSIPFLLGTALSLSFGYGLLPAIVVGALLASHTLLGSRIVAELGASRLEPVTVTIGATLLSDTLSLVVFAICVTTYERGFSMFEPAVQLFKIAIVVPLIVFGLSRVGAYALQKAEGEEDAYFVLMFGIMAAAGVLAQTVNLPGIAAAFLAGVAVNAAAHDKPATEKLAFFSNAFFIPIFFVVTGFLIDPTAFVQSINDNFGLVAAIIVVLVASKWLAAALAGRAFKYTSAAYLTMWSLTLPQVTTRLAAALVAFNTLDPAGQRLIDRRMLDVVLVLMLTTAILGPLLTQQFAPHMLADSSAREALNGRVP